MVGYLNYSLGRSSTTHDGVEAGKVHVWSQDEEGVTDLVIVSGASTKLNFCTAARAAAIRLGGQVVEHPADIQTEFSGRIFLRSGISRVVGVGLGDGVEVYWPRDVGDESLLFMATSTV